jgi:hypothetical protein
LSVHIAGLKKYLQLQKIPLSFCDGILFCFFKKIKFYILKSTPKTKIKPKEMRFSW